MREYKVLALFSSLAIILLHIDDILVKSKKYDYLDLTVVEYDHRRAEAIQIIFPEAKVIEADAYEWVQRPHVDLNEYSFEISTY